MASTNESTESVPFDKSSPILETDLTYDWLERTLQGCLTTCATLHTCRATRIGVGQGFLSYIIRLELKWLQETQDDKHLPSDLVLKVPTTTTFKNIDKTFNVDNKKKETIKKMMENMDVESMIKKAHQSECEMYRLLSALHEQLHMPKCYHQEMISDNSPGAIIMEYLGDKGVAKTLVEPLNLEALLQVADVFATLHSWCIKNRSLWEGNVHLKSGFGYMMAGNSEAKTAENVQLTIDLLKECWPGKFDQLAERIREFGYTAEDAKRYCKMHEQFNISPVLVHGDLHMGNMMFYKDDDTKMQAKILAIIDWQTVHPGCAAEDFARLFTSSVATDVRRDHTDQILKRYHDTLTAKLDGQDPGFSYEMLRKAYRKIFKWSTVSIIGVFPFFAKQTQLLGDDPKAKAIELMDRAYGILVDAVATLGENQ